ncbi:hypothetical protein LTR95_015403 [Oleoguttula sp. CCFEE 5521]
MVAKSASATQRKRQPRQDDAAQGAMFSHDLPKLISISVGVKEFTDMVCALANKPDADFIIVVCCRPSEDAVYCREEVHGSSRSGRQIVGVPQHSDKLVARSLH